MAGPISPTGSTGGGSGGGDYPGSYPIVNADVAAGAAIAAGKIAGTAVTQADTGTVTAAMLAGSIPYSKLALSAGDVPYSKLTLTGDIVNADVASGAAIAYGKLNLAGSIVDADVASGAAIAYSKLNLTGAILNADLAGSIAASKVSGTAVTQADTGTVTSAMITDGTIVNGDIASGAAIAYSKLALTGAILNADLAGSIAYSKLSLTGSILNADLAGSIAASKITGTAITAADSGTVTSTMIADGTIVNADISASAAIAYSKLNLASSIVTGDIVDGTITMADLNNTLNMGSSQVVNSQKDSSGQPFIQLDAKGVLWDLGPALIKNAYTYAEFSEASSLLGSAAGMTQADTTGTGAQLTSATGAAGHFGIARFQSGSTSSGLANVRGGLAAVQLGSPTRWRFSAWVRVPTLSTSSQRFVVGLGYGDQAALQAPNSLGSVNCVMFRYADNINSGKWQLVNNNAGSAVSTDTGVTVNANQWYLMEFEVDATGLVLSWWIDGGSTASGSSSPGSMPTAAMTYGIGALKSVGGTNTNMLDVDNMSIMTRNV